MPLGPTGGRIMAEIVAAALAAHAPLITGKPEIARPEQRERLYAGFHEMRRRLAAARPDLLVMFVNDHLQNFPYSNLPAFCVGLVDAYDAPSPGGSTLMRIPPVATGGISHWVGTPETGRINPEWDHWVIDHIERGDVEPLLRLTWDEIERDGGNGGQEIRNWVALMGAVPGWKGESLAYEPVPEWITGCGTVWVHA